MVARLGDQSRQSSFLSFCPGDVRALELLLDVNHWLKIHT